jgi:adenine-specific DNA glycosylase
MEELLMAWFEENRRDLPRRRTADPYSILVSEVMLQQRQVARVVARYEEWLARWLDVHALAKQRGCLSEGVPRRLSPHASSPRAGKRSLDL